MNQPLHSTAGREPASPSIIPEELARMKTAIDTGSVVGSLIRICSAAAEFADDQEGYSVAKHLPASIAHVLKHTETLMTDVIIAMELAVNHLEGQA